MRRWSVDQAAVSAVLATVMLVAVVIVMAGAVFMLTRDMDDQIGEVPPSVALATVGSETGRSAWHLKLAVALPARPIDEFVFIVRTPENGTLVVTPADGAFDGDRDFFFQLGASAGDGVHRDNESTVGNAGLGGFRVWFADIGGDAYLGGGDRIAIFYDGDGDQAHTTGSDDQLPGGVYAFEIKSKAAERYIGLEERSF